MTLSARFAAAIDDTRIGRIVDDSLHGLEDGELYIEHVESEALSFDDGRLKSASYDSSGGFGLRGVMGETTAYAHASDLSEAALRRAAGTIRTISQGKGGQFSVDPIGTNRRLYAPDSPLEGPDFAARIALLEAIDGYARSLDPRVHQVSVSLASSIQSIAIRRPGGFIARDSRPLTRLNINIALRSGERIESASHGGGGRRGIAEFFDEQHWKAMVDEAFRQADIALESVDAPAGTMPVVLGPGWPGILLHEAVGHGLEGDFNRKKTSAFAGRLGERVAAPGVTVIDDGTIEGRRGSLSIDDEGTPSRASVLIEDGILKGYMQDRLNARLMGMEPTGNGRRESYAHQPMPRMTNTFMPAGEHDPAEIIASVKDGLYAVNFGGGQVDITSGKFVFSCTEAYRIRGGRIAEPVKGATLIGNGPDVLKRVRMIGNDFALDPGVGTCGKAGQSVPAGVGQPTLLIDALTVGGTA
ncbi:MAG: metalloprotease TldD [Rhodothalassiaceae bacterium]